MTYGSNITAYDYDGDGQRVQRTMLNVTTVYLGAYYEKNLSTGVVTKCYYLGGRRAALRQGSSVYYLFPDHLGSTRVTADSNGNRVAELWYRPYGNTRLTWGSTPTDRRYTGQVFDSNAGLYYYGACYYDALVGRFISPDPIVPEPGNPQSLNRYSYVRNNPLRYVDPTGRWTFEETPDDPHFAPPGWPYPATRCVSACPEPPVLGPALEILNRTRTGQPIVQFALSHDITVWFGVFNRWDITGGRGVTMRGGGIILPPDLQSPSVMRENALLVAHELVHVMQNVERGDTPWHRFLQVDLDREVEAYVIEQVIAYEMAYAGNAGLSVQQARVALTKLIGTRASAYAYVKQRGAGGRINPYARLGYSGGQGDLTSASELLNQPLFPLYVRDIVNPWWHWQLAMVVQ